MKNRHIVDKKGLKTLILSSAAGCAILSPTSAWAAEITLEEVVVTAQRREQSLSDVPISISAHSRAKMDVQGIRDIDGVARLTPGISFSRSNDRNSMDSSISIRGIASSAGASTTGIYIDDTPIQIRSLGYSSFNSFPRVFDLERIEVLRGPQGTLYGGGSQGGTVRFITPDPDYGATKLYGRAEAATTQNGAASYEAGLAVGTPIVEDRLALRVSGWYRRDGGWVDRVNFDRNTFEMTDVGTENANAQDSYVFKASLAFAASDTLEISDYATLCLEIRF